MSTVALPLLRAVASRTSTDRLELLTALLNAPAVGPLFRADLIRVPANHSTYAWGCVVPNCARARAERRDYCQDHSNAWAIARTAGTTLPDFLSSATPLEPYSWQTTPECVICPGLPGNSDLQLCYRHADRWHSFRAYEQRQGRAASFDTWMARQPVFPSYGICRVVACPELAFSATGLCGRHHGLYKIRGRPGGARPATSWGRWDHLHPPVETVFDDEAVFRRWCWDTDPICRNNGQLTLLGLSPLLKAEIQWSLHNHTQGVEGAHWPLSWVQHLVNVCRTQRLNSLADVDLDGLGQHPRQVAKAMLVQLRLVYFTREDTKQAGFLETAHFGIRYRGRESHVDLSRVTQKWLRDLLWEFIADRLSTASPPRSRSPIDTDRRGCTELSAFLETAAPGGGHDPALLHAEHMTAFVVDQRHRARLGLTSLGLFTTDGQRTTVTEGTMATSFDGTRRVLRAALESGRSQHIGLDRAFIVALPNGGNKGGRRRPFPDDAARALADEDNLRQLDELDQDDRGLRDIWETLIMTGRRASEVLELRLECLGLYNNLPMLWHDQTKVGNYDQAIRIPQRLHDLLAERQRRTALRFQERHGRLPAPEERRRLALFPRRSTNRDGLRAISYGWFNNLFRVWVDQMDIEHCVPHQARHTLATNLLRNGAGLAHVKRYLGQVSERMAEHYVHIASTDKTLEDALHSVWVAGPGSARPGEIVSAGGTAMSRSEAEAMALDLNRRSTPAEGGFCTFQPVVNGDACPWNLDCHNCDKFVMSGADLVYWRRKQEQWASLAERSPDDATADYLHSVFEPTARAIDGLEKALAAVGLLDDALNLDLRRPQDYFGRVWSIAFRSRDLVPHQPEA